MIIVELKGGFGNQLFQYAAGISLSNFHEVPLRIDTSSFKIPDAVTGTHRQSGIFCLANTPQEASENELKDFNKKNSLSKHLQRILPFHKRTIFKEKSLFFDPHFFEAGSNVYLKGNRQSEKYFKPYESVVKNDFQLSENAIESVKTFSQNLDNNSVSVHIRRGDYLTPIALEWLGILPLSYYHEAINILKQKVDNCKFYFFSDDIEWVKQNFGLDSKHVFVSTSVTKTQYEDFYLMSQCRHNIIANSSFSWWAAWLNPNPYKIVIAPQKWFNKAPLDTRDLIPESWIKI